MAKSEPQIVCTPLSLPEDLMLQAAMTAIDVNPMNRPAVEQLYKMKSAPKEVQVADHLAVMTTKYWGINGVKLTVGFMEQIAPELRDRIISHLNAWGEYCNVKFTYSRTNPEVRITRGGQGYWSYLGTDVLSIAKNQPTMCLQGFSMSTPESEYKRVIRHEVGHTLGMPHEHLRRELIARLDANKTIDYFKRTQGWSAEMTKSQVLTPLEESSLLGTDHADDDSIMCYQLPGEITIDGKPITGGNDIDEEDKVYCAKVYPKQQPPEKPKPPEPKPPEPVTAKKLLISGDFTYQEVT